MTEDYKDKQDRKKERFRLLAEKNRVEAQSRYDRAKSQVSEIHFGQPILPGRAGDYHRAAIKRYDSHMRKGVETEQKAEEYERRAEAVGSGGISSDDPGAIGELKRQLECLEREQKERKRVNSEYRKRGIDGITGIDEETRDKLKKSMATYGDQPFPRWSLSNSSANIRRVKRRIEQLERRETEAPRPDILGSGYQIREDKEENRIFVDFEKKPGPEIRIILKEHGFRWARSKGLWCRMLSESGRYMAREAHKKMEKVVEDESGS